LFYAPSSLLSSYPWFYDVMSTSAELGDISDEFNVHLDLRAASNDQNPLVSLSSDNKRLICAFLGCLDTVASLRLVSKNAFQTPDYDFALSVSFKGGFMAGSDAPKSTPAFSGLQQAIRRKRIRTNGYYALKEMVTKAPNNDSFWEERKVHSIETIHYRTLRFLDNGCCLYALNTHAPWENPMEIEPQRGEEAVTLMTLSEKRSMKLRDSVSVGSWFWDGKTIQVQVDVEYCYMLFSFDLIHGCDSYGNYHGNHTVLSMLKHAQIVDKGSRREQEVEFKLPTNPDFIFHRRWFMDPRDNYYL
jgi:hypothetical protein